MHLSVLNFENFPKNWGFRPIGMHHAYMQGYMRIWRKTQFLSVERFRMRIARLDALNEGSLYHP